MSESNQIEIRKLIERCRQGDREAQFKLYRQYANAMLNCGYRIVNNRNDAEDVLQEAFLKAFEKIRDYKGTASFGAWLKRIVVNTAINFLKQKKITFVDLEPVTADLEKVSDDDAETSFPIDADQAYEALHSLPVGYRTVLSLYLLEGYDHQEIAEILGISRSASLSQFHRGKKRLRQQILKKKKDGQTGKMVRRT